MARPKGKRPTSVKIYEGADGSWHGYLTVGVKPDGRPDRRHRMGKTREEVEQKIRDLEDKYLRDELLAPGRAPTLEQYLSGWLASVKPHVSYKTWKDSYEYACRVYIVPGLGAHRLDDLEANPKYIDHFYARLIGSEDEAGLTSPGNAALIHRVFRTALNDAVRHKVIQTNPVLAARAPESDAEEIKPLDAQEQQQLLAALADHRTGTRWLVAMLGPRQGEVLGLRWDDIEWDTGIATIEGKAQRRNWQHGCSDPARCARWRHGCKNSARCGLDAWRCSKREVRCREKPCPRAWQHGCSETARCKAKLAYACKQRKPAHCPRHRGDCPPPCAPGCTKHAERCPQRHGGGVRIETEETRGRRTSRRRLKTKTKAGKRRIAFPREVLDELLAHRERQAAEREHAGDMWVEHGLVFTTITGRPIDPKRDWEDWKALLRKAKLRDVRPHDARHTAATILLAKGVDRRVVMDIMGWASEKMLPRYQHVVDEMRTEAAQRMGDVLFGSASSAEDRARVAALKMRAAVPSLSAEFLAEIAALVGFDAATVGRWFAEADEIEAVSATDHATESATNVTDLAKWRKSRRSAG